MRATVPVVLLSLCLGSQAAWADSIDEAEAKRRGVPVSLVQAENALAKEKLKTAALEKQIAELQKQIAASGGAPAPGTPATPASSNSSPSNAPAKMPAFNFDGPRAASALCDDIINRYLTGNWTTLAADMAAREKEIAVLPEGNRADLTYISHTLAECRPAWWEQVKSGKLAQVRQMVWGRTANITFKDASAGVARADWTRQPPNSVISCPLADMDATDPITLMYIGIGSNSDVNFTRADGVSVNLWGCIGAAQIMQQVDMRGMTPVQQDQFLRYATFWQSLTSLYYGTPPARRLAMIQSATYHAGQLPLGINEGFRAIASEYLLEIKTHVDDYGNLGIRPESFYIDPQENGAEFLLADFVINRKMMKPGLTLAQDRAIRELARRLAETNGDWKNPKILLSHNLRIDLNQFKDEADALERLKFLKIERPR
jgi:hypothetical protein